VFVVSLQRRPYDVFAGWFRSPVSGSISVGRYPISAPLYARRGRLEDLQVAETVGDVEGELAYS
jgi:hypothetical protein